MSTTSAAVIGRERELELLREFTARVTAPFALLIEGEAGIGKTTLWKEGVAAGLELPGAVLSCRPSGAETRLAYAALADLLEEIGDDFFAALPTPQREALEVALLKKAGRGAIDRRAVAAATLGILRLVAETGPVLLAIDDVQWLDRPSAAALEFAIRRLGDEPVRLLLTVRRESGTQAPLGLERALPDDQLRLIQLSPLTLGALHHLLVTRLGTPFSRPVLRRLHEASGGNPLYALELARALRRRDVRVRPGEPLPVPGSLGELVHERLEGLPEHAQRVVALAATLSHPTLEAVDAAAGTGTDGAVDAAIDAGVLELDGERLRFTHPLLASVVYSSLGPDERRDLHGRAARIARDPEERARHLALGAAGTSEEAASAAAEAARGAAARGAPEAAAELAELSLRLTPPDERQDLRRRRLEAADYHYRAGALAPARAILEQIIDELPEGAERAEALCRLALVREDDFDVTRELLERSAAEAGSDDALLAEIDFLLSQVWHVRLDLRRSLAHARGAVEAAERLDDAALLARNLAQVALIEKLSGEMTPGLLERGVELERTLDPYALRHRRPSAVLGLRLMALYRIEAARPLLEQAHEVARAQGDAYAEAAGLLYLSGLESRSGAWRLALSYAEQGLELVEQLGLDQSRSAFLSCKARVLAQLGRVEEASAAAEQAVALSEAANDEIFRLESLGILGFIRLSLDDYAGAQMYLGPLPDLLVAAGHFDPGTIPVLPDAIEASVAVGDRERASTLLVRLEEQARSGENAWARAVAGRCRGLLSAADGELDRGLAELNGALSEQDLMASPFDRGRALLALGSVQRRSKHRRAARESLLAALETFEQLGAALWAAKARAELARIGGRAPASGVLSPSERRVAELAAEGRSNKEIGAALSITPRTVEGHLTRVYAKLGVQSRAQLAHLIGGRGVEESQSQGVSEV